jgi:cobaltochelatase CobT
MVAFGKGSDRKMTKRSPIAFLSYVRHDDEHDQGTITRLRERLEGEVKVQSGKPFEIFQDRNDIRWGQFWEERIVKSLSEVTLLIPIVTPSFFVSAACRSEFDTFLKMEKTLGVPRLILPLYYVSCDDLDDPKRRDDPIVKAIKERQWTDWRPLRFKPHDAPEVRSALAALATNIKQSIQELNLIAAAASTAKKHIPEPSSPLKMPVERSRAPVEESDIRPVLRRGKNHEKPQRPYYAYTDEFDEIVEARELIGEAGELLALQDVLSQHIRKIKQDHNTLLESFPSSSGENVSIAVTLLLDTPSQHPITLLHLLRIQIHLPTHFPELRRHLRHAFLGLILRNGAARLLRMTGSALRHPVLDSAAHRHPHAFE